MRFKNKNTGLLVILAIVVVGFAFLVSSGFNFFGDVIPGTFDEMGFSQKYGGGTTGTTPHGAVLDIAAKAHQYDLQNHQMLPVGKELKRPAYYAAMQPTIDYVGIYTYTGDSKVYAQIVFQNGLTVNHVYGAGEAGRYGSGTNLMIRLDGCINATERLLYKASTMDSYKECNAAQISVYIDRTKELQPMATTTCTQPEYDTCCDGSKVMTSACTNGQLVGTGKICKSIQTLCPDNTSTPGVPVPPEHQCVGTNAPLTWSGCPGGVTITIAECINFNWVATNATCPGDSTNVSCVNDIVSACPDATKIVLAKCTNGKLINTGAVCSSNSVNTENKTPSTCQEGYIKQFTCESGAKVDALKCVDGNWKDIAYDCGTGGVVQSKDNTDYVFIIAVIVVMILAASFVWMLIMKR